MHNKLFVADNALAITGGRNIGDEYFTRDQRNNFIDLDVVAAGAIVPELSASFDAFWNSKYAYPIASVASPVSAEPRPPPPVEDVDSRETPNGWSTNSTSGSVPLTWVPATVLADRPAKIASETSPDEEVTIANDLARSDALGQAGAHRDLPVLRARQGRRRLVRQARGRRACTFGSSPTRWRRPIRPWCTPAMRATAWRCSSSAIELSEVRPKLGQKRARFHPFRSSNASLHAKALVIDQKTVFIGSHEHGCPFGAHQQRTRARDAQRGDRPPGHQPAR